MSAFSRISIKHKITAIIMLVCIPALILTAIMIHQFMLLTAALLKYQAGVEAMEFKPWLIMRTAIKLAMLI